MLQEEADAEGNAIDHTLELSPEGPFTPIERIYVDAYQQGGRKRGQEALLTAFESGLLTTSTTGESYAQYYTKQWYAARREQHAQARTILV